MIGIVVVSHSRALADAAVGLAREMVHGQGSPAIAVAAGLDATTFGTDAAAVASAVEEVDSPDGVLVLLDLGSAVLSAEMALEFVDREVASRVRLSSAPLVEGLVAAVVLASTDADLDAVAEEAGHGLAAKQEHLGDGGVAEPAVGSTSTHSDRGGSTSGDGPVETSIEVVVTNAHGLHARPAAKVVTLVRGYDAEVTVTNLDTGRGPVRAASLSGVATLDARRGHRLRIAATGPQSAQVLAAFDELAGRSFDDQDGPPPDDTVAAAGATMSGSGLDVAFGPADVLLAQVDTTSYSAGDIDEERSRSQAATDAVRGELVELERRTTAENGPEAGAIFAAHLALLDDPDVGARVAADVDGGAAAADAWTTRLDEVAAEFDSLPDAYQRERATDVRSVQAAVLRHLVGGEHPEPSTTGHEDPAIVVTRELDATTAASLDLGQVAGVVTTAGGKTGHGAIVAASRGIPLITGVREASSVRNGQLIAFDAREGRFWSDVDAGVRTQLEDLVSARQAERDEVVATALEPASTTDGVRVPVLANVASAADAQTAAKYGAEGSGLVRTEVLFGDRRAAPGVDEQAEVFVALSRSLGGQPMTIRTWDVGGDKPLPFHPQQAEANPFLGERGIRVFRGDHAAGLLDDQLAAICLAAREVELRVMFPMVTERSEVDAAVSRLQQVGARVSSGVPEGLGVGIMIEVPAAAMTVELLAPGLDFVSIGTNDLTQYTVAADRGNAAVAHLADPLTPGVLRLVAHVCRERPAGVEVAVCGDLASQVEAVPLLLGLGVDELSCTPPRVPEVKAAVRRTDLGAARRLAAEALTRPSAAAVRALL